MGGRRTEVRRRCGGKRGGKGLDEGVRTGRGKERRDKRRQEGREGKNGAEGLDGHCNPCKLQQHL